VRLVLPSTPARAAITYGAPFYGVGWTEIAEGTAPRNSDEIAPADQLNYREVQGWLHLAGAQGGLAITTDHPGFHYADGQPHGELSAVLLRTSPSCGDHRLFWENAGEQVFQFTLRPVDGDWRAARVQEQAASDLRPPVARLVRGGAGGLPPSQSFLRLEAASAALSSLYPDGETGAALLRLWETAGATQEVTLAGPLAGGTAQVVNLLGEEVGPPPSGQPGRWQVSLGAWGIRTVRIRQ
jgi:alpha-mannosidase